MSLGDDIHGAGAADDELPEAQRWAFFVARGIQPVCTFVRRRARDSGPPRLVIAYPGASPPIPPDPMIAWEPLLEDWLLAHRVRATSAANEAERLGFDLGARLAALEARAGTTEFTAVLLRYLYDHDCPLYVPLERKLGAIRSYEPEPCHAYGTTCEAMNRMFTELVATVEALGYPADVGAQICRDALAYCLRDRFDIT